MFATDKKRLWRFATGGCAALAGLSVWFFLHHLEQNYQDSGETLAVLAASHYIPRGSPLRPVLFQRVRIPKAYVEPGAVADFEVLESSGRPRYRSLLPIPEGTHLLQRELTPLTQGETLSEIIGENQVAVSFGVDPVRGLGGNIQPGDLIDVLHTAKASEADLSQRPTDTLFQAVPVIAVGKKWMAPSFLNEVPSKGEDRPEKEDEETTVLTVLLNPLAAVRLAQARENETLSVVLRAPGDNTILEKAQ